MAHLAKETAGTSLTRSPRSQQRILRLFLVLVMTLIGLVSFSTTPVVRAAPNVRVRVVIEHVKALDDVDNPLDPFNADADFYSRVKIDDEEFPLQGPIDNEDEINPNWTFVKDIDFAAKQSVPVNIQIWDSDGFFNLKDNLIDLTPPNGRDLNLRINLSPCAITGDTSGICQQSITVRGRGDNRAEMRFRIELEFPNTPGLKIQCLQDPIWPQATDTITFTANAFDDTFTAKFVDNIELWVNSEATPVQSGSNVTSISTTQGPFPDGQTVFYGCLARSGSDVAWSGWKVLQVGQPANGVAVPVIYTGPRENRIDIVFTPDVDTYTGANDPQFLADVQDIIQQVYYREDLILRNQGKFNFWIVPDRLNLNHGDIDGAPDIKCTRLEPPSNWNTDYAFADSGAIVHNDALRDCANSDKRIFGALVNHNPVTGDFDAAAGRVFLHEMGHAPFGLADEYCCDGGYFPDPEHLKDHPYPNVYPNLLDCQKDALATFDDNCQVITTTMGLKPITFYRLDRASTLGTDLMATNPPGPPEQADIRRIQWVLDEVYTTGRIPVTPGIDASTQFASPNAGPSDPLPRLDLSDQTKTLAVSLKFQGLDQVSLNSAQMFVGKSPTHLGNPPLLRVRLLNGDNNLIEEYNEWNPLWTFYEGSDGREHLSIEQEATGRFIVPFSRDLRTMEVVDTSTQKKLITVDLRSSAIIPFCKQHPDDPDCVALGLSHFVYLPLITIPPPAPDLIGTFSLSPNKQSFKTGEPVTITATITNQGTAASGPFWTDLFINPSTIPTASNTIWSQVCKLQPCFGIAWQVPSLGPGETVTLISTSDSYATGHTVWPGWFVNGTTNLYLYVDTWNPGVPYGAVAENDETNNRADLKVNVTGINPTHASLTTASELPPRPVLDDK